MMSKLTIRNQMLYDGMSLDEMLRERKATLAQLRIFQKQRPSLLKMLQIEKTAGDIRTTRALMTIRYEEEGP